MKRLLRARPSWASSSYVELACSAIFISWLVWLCACRVDGASSPSSPSASSASSEMIAAPATVPVNWQTMQIARTIVGRASGVQPPGGFASPRCVVLVVADDVGKDDLAYVSSLGGTPNLDYLSAHGFAFNCAISSPVCSPDRRQMYWGRWHTRTSEVCQAADGTEPSLSEPSLFEALLPIPTDFEGKWHVGSNPTGPWELTPQRRGCRSWDGLPHYVAGCGGHDYYFWPRVGSGVSDLPVNLYQPGWMLAKAMQRLAVPDQLMVFAAQLAHEPYHRPPAGMLPAGWPATHTDRQRFWAMVAALDYQVGRLLTKLDPARDVLIFMGDNGTEDSVAPVAFQGKAKTTTFERGIRVPLIFAGAGVPVGTSDALVSSVDVYNTILEMYGVPQDVTLDGRSLVPIMNGSVAPVHDYVFSGIEGDPRFPGDVCARSLQYKLRVLDLDGNGTTDEEHFYDLVADPTETVDLIGDASLATAIQQHRDWLAGVRP